MPYNIRSKQMNMNRRGALFRGHPASRTTFKCIPNVQSSRHGLIARRLPNNASTESWSDANLFVNIIKLYWRNTYSTSPLPIISSQGFQCRPKAPLPLDDPLSWGHYGRAGRSGALIYAIRHCRAAYSIQFWRIGGAGQTVVVDWGSEQ